MSEATAPNEPGTHGSSPQVVAALAARAKMERLLAVPTPFADDDGSADAHVLAALEAHRAAAAQGPAQARAAMVEVVAALRASRVIVPVAAHSMPAPQVVHLGRDAGTEIPQHSVHTNDASQDAAALAVTLPDGHKALPVFTSAAAMRTWRTNVRPVPVVPQRAAQVACATTDRLWVLDPGSQDLRVPRPAVVALAGGRAWVPSWENPPVQEEIRARLEPLEGVTAVAFAAGESAELRVLIRIDAAGGRSAVAATLEACQHVMANPAWGELIDTVELCPLPA